MGFLTSGKIVEHMISGNALAPQTLATTNTTGPWYGFKKGTSLKFTGLLGAAAATNTVVFRLQQATDEEGAGAKEVSVAQGATINTSATITANTLVSAVTLTLATVLDTHAVTIVDNKGNTTILTGTDTGPAGVNEFLCEVSDNADAAALAAAINLYVPNVIATVNAAVVTVWGTEDSGAAITVTNSTGATITVATLRAACLIEVSEAQLDTDNDFRYVALYADTGAHTLPVAGTVERVARNKPHTQPMASVIHEDA